MAVDGAHGAEGGAPALDVIERQTAVLVRNFELLHRRSDAHEQLDRAEYLLLRVLAEHGPQDINSLAALLGLDPSTAGRQVSALTRQELVERTPAATDRRRCIVTPTSEGLRLMEAVRAARSERLAGLLDGWDEEELRLLGAMFTKYNRAVAEHFLTPPADLPVPAL
ncbi:MarR family winged helix-turn-helix transcriptional regulator [Actinacidiphila guanduensis]|uniref:DNA-binding transcriptional regulator, MarR family n=1 Tax=Actinacidiphila guanduensis TaxID=310781 RepID=A0A1G9YG65_9ACTN|nr:MarR family transcriptional regulator [Actinacidiphila guanduensis]SDN07473.1 DNA-binding transcriptional regulator, MarR family [Actinacidiphila guanduensis]